MQPDKCACKKCKICVAAYHRAWCAANPERSRAHKEKYRVAHPEVWRKGAATQRARYPEKVAERRLKWGRDNPDKVATLLARRRFRKANAEGRHTADEWASLILSHGGACYDCGMVAKMTRGHLVPFARGGSDWITNVVPQCRACNSRQGTKIHSSLLPLKV